MFDALRRKFQCATVQLDFQLPIRFNLQVVFPLMPRRPVVHRRGYAQLPPVRVGVAQLTIVKFFFLEGSMLTVISFVPRQPLVHTKGIA